MLPPIGGAAKLGRSKEEFHLLRLAATLHILTQTLSQIIDETPGHVHLQIPLVCLKAAHSLYRTLCSQKSIMLEVIMNILSH
jgi:hypothetical protein